MSGFSGSYYSVDPEFDEDDGSDIAFIQHQIETHGAIAIHPDGDRCNSGAHPVPLCSHVPDGDNQYAEFFSKKLFLRRRTREIREHQEYVKRWDAEYASRWSRPPPEPLRPVIMMPPMQEEPSPPWEPPPEPPETFGPMGPVLINLRLGEPIAASMGRIWRDYIMVNACDAPTLARKWAEVWRGRGYVVFRTGTTTGMIYEVD